MRFMSMILFLVFVATMSQNSLAAPPNPILTFAGAEYATVNGQNIVRYRFDVFNKEMFGNEMFVASPSLAPCGQNTNASRSWVDLYDQKGKRLNGFCALGNSSQLYGIWFALGADEIPPSWIYIEITDRQTGVKYKSNLAETTL